MGLSGNVKVETGNLETDNEKELRTNKLQAQQS